MATGETDPLLTKNEKEIAHEDAPHEEEAPQSPGKTTLGESIPKELIGQQSLAHGGGARFEYAPHEVIYNLFCRFRGTVLPCIFKRHTFPMCIALYAFANICHHGFPDDCAKAINLPRLTIGDLAGTLLPLLTFFLAFFTAECYGRFKQQYDNLKRIEGYMRTIGIQCKANAKFPEEATIELFRYLNAAYYVLFCRLYDGKDEDLFNIKSALDMGLLTYQETVALQPMPENMQWFKLLSWSFAHVEETCEDNDIISREKSEIQHGILGIRETMNAVTYTFQMPVPLAYYHAITAINVFTCLLYSYASGYDKKVSPELGWLCTGLMLFGFYGMQEVALQLADPFGDDDCDLPVDSYVQNTMNFMQMFLEDKSEERIPHWDKDFKQQTFWAQGRVPDPDRVAQQEIVVKRQYDEYKKREKAAEEKEVENKRVDCRKECCDCDF